jgi:transcriptional regulator
LVPLSAIEIEISRLVGKWKVSQNGSAADRAGVRDGLRQDDAPQAVAMAALL